MVPVLQIVHAHLVHIFTAYRHHIISCKHHNDFLPMLFLVGIAAFESDYARWIEEQNKQICELRNALNTHITDAELKILVESGMSHYFELFQLKANAAKADVFYLMSGMWKTSAERFFLWIGGFRPSELLKVIHVLLMVIYFC